MRTYQDQFTYRQAFHDLVRTEQFADPFAVTLTLRQGLNGSGGMQGQFKRIERYDAEQNFRHFMNLLNRQVYGHAAERYGKRVQVVPVLEGGSSTRYHYHAIIDCPRPQLHFEFPAMIRSCWLRTPWGYDQIDIQSSCNEGWTNYISKFRSKVEYDMSFDWTNCHLD